MVRVTLETIALPGMSPVLSATGVDILARCAFLRRWLQYLKTPLDTDDDVQTVVSHRYLDAISDDSECSVTAWYIQAMVNNNEVVFKVDTGAEVTAISKEVYDAIGQPRLTKPTKVLCGPSRQPLDVLGRTTVHLRVASSCKESRNMIYMYL